MEIRKRQRKKMHWIGEQNILVHYTYENAIEIIAEGDLK